MATNKLFSVVGVSTYHGLTKARWANDLVARIKIFNKEGHTNVDLIELPQPMTKLAAAQYYFDLKKGQLSPDAEFAVQTAIEDRVAEDKKAAFKVTGGKKEISLAEIAKRPKIEQNV